MTTDKEELRKEFLDIAGDYLPNEQQERLLFDLFYSKIEAKDREIAELDEQLQLQHDYITDLIAKLGAKDKECAAKIAAGERLRMEDAMSAINEANGLRQKIKDQELIIYGIEEGSAQWESLCHDKEKQITDLKAEVEWLKGALTSR